MIVDPDNNNTMAVGTPPENPPSYDYAVENVNEVAPPPNPKPTPPPLDIKHPPSMESPSPHGYVVGPSHSTQPGFIQSPTVYHYTHPATQEHVVSLLPPDHPEMICLQAGAHVPHTNYGILGILAAVFWFPLGIGLCLLDRRVRCTRCGAMLNDGICD
ncbi:hypothetical protein BDZ94DRAFT_1185987 [Collybia nuda]|uniref:Membrane protein BRI3 n=1 Tax=Collybia nuda TaxID=64659 RepID=A0A9P5YGY5_9AGAR|nr:hypothetical protein BDZ94DRAFT_1185987 [Collybia nuda]